MIKESTSEVTSQRAAGWWKAVWSFFWNGFVRRQANALQVAEAVFQR